MPPKKDALAKGGHRGVAHPKTKEEIAEYYQQWYKKNRTKVLKRIKKQRSLEGGAYSDEGETDNEDNSDDEDAVNPLALPHYWDGQQFVPVVPNIPPVGMEDDELIGEGLRRMRNGCSLYTGGNTLLFPINYNAELKNNSYYPQGYSGGRLMPVNYNTEMKSSFGSY